VGAAPPRSLDRFVLGIFGCVCLASLVRSCCLGGSAEYQMRTDAAQPPRQSLLSCTAICRQHSAILACCFFFWLKTDNVYLQGQWLLAG